MRFFDINIAHIGFPGTYTAICESANADSCFDELDYTLWSSNEYDDDDLSVWVERDFLLPKSINRVFVKDTNIQDIILEHWNGSAWIATETTVYKSVDLQNIFFEFDDLTVSKIRVTGSHTLVANQEKNIGNIFVFTELGKLNIPPADINAKRIKEQDIYKLINGKKITFNKGGRWEIDLIFQAHIGQSDIDILNSLVIRDCNFFIWINDNTEAAMRQIVEPYAFKNLLKVSVMNGDSPNYYKNIWVSGMSNKISMAEVE
jgi:hypothetical protein